MEEMEVVRLLQNYRHDVMNRLQIVQGYLTMGKMDKAETKMEELFSYFDEERRLISLKAPRFILWLIQFNALYNNFRITYNIHINRSLSTMDDYIISQSKAIMDLIETYSNPNELYEIELDIKEDKLQIEFIFFVEGEFKDCNVLNINEEKKNKMNNIHLLKEADGIVYRFKLPRNG